MKTSLSCLPCLIRQALDATGFVTSDPLDSEPVMRQVLRALADIDLNVPPPAVAQVMHRVIRQATGSKDPFKQLKDRFNDLARDMMPEMRAKLAADPDPFDLAVRLAIAGNVIDVGAKSDLGEADASTAVAKALAEPLSGDMAAFKHEASMAGSILYLADNAGEIFFDRLLVEQLAPSRVTVAVRGSAVLNDATVQDALAAGMHEVAEVVDNGSDAPGTILTDCSHIFQERWAAADLVVSKGQGNYESLSGEANGKKIIYLLKVKCSVIASRTGGHLGEHIMLRED